MYTIRLDAYVIRREFARGLYRHESRSAVVGLGFSVGFMHFFFACGFLVPGDRTAA
jgi:hypothetical protein